MGKKNTAYKYRIYPTKEQQVLLAKTFGCVRFVYNHMLADRIEHYEKTGESLNNTPAMYKSEFPFLKEVDSLALANAQLHLNSAYKNFFRDAKVGFPCFKKKSFSQSYTTNKVGENIRIENGRIRLPKIGMVKIKLHRNTPSYYLLKSVTVSRTASGKFYASVLYEYESDVQPKDIKTAIGLDYSMPELYVDSNGKEPHYPKYYRTMQEKLSKEQRKLSRCKKGSKNYYKQKRRVAIVHEKIANQRKDFLHKQSREIANLYDAVCVEDLNMHDMAQALHFGKSVHDNGWGMFTNFLSYKLTEQGKQLTKVSRIFPSSKLCRHCGYKYNDLKLEERLWQCPNCKKLIDRDYNAAINILNEGLRLLA